MEEGQLADDLFLLSGGRELYEGCTVAGIDCTPGYEHMEFGNTREVALGRPSETLTKMW